MDIRTLQAYDAGAAGFAKEWHGQAAPSDMHDLLLRYFRHGPTADVGCGAGRDVGWLVANHYDACGFDASEALLREARARYPGLVFDPAGRLYSAFEKQAVLDALDSGVTVLFDREDVSVSSGKRIHRLIVRQAEQAEQSEQAEQAEQAA